MADIVAIKGRKPAGRPSKGPQQQSAGATIHRIYDPFDPPQSAIVSVARRLQEVLIEYGALSPDGVLPFPALAPVDDD